MKKQETWILVADGSRARVFRLRETETAIGETEKNLEPAWEDVPIGSRRRSREIASDRPGRTFDSSGQGRHAKEPHTDPAQYEKKRFAHELIERLEGERRRHAFDRLLIVAPPQFLGELRNQMPSPLEACVVSEIDKDLSKLSPGELLDRLGDELGR